MQEKSDYQAAVNKTKNIFLAPVKSGELLISVGVILTALVIMIISNYFSLLKTRQEVENYSEIKGKLETEKLENELKTISKKSNLTFSWRSFGDNFSSCAYISADNTNMFFDEKVTAFMFPPVYTFNSVFGCKTTDCNLKASSLILTDRDNDKKPSKTPAELDDKKIISSRLDKLSSLQIASFIVSEGQEERAYVYFFDGRKFSPIITDKTENKIITKYSRGGGIISVGGDDDDFLILYLGYEGMGFHYKNGQTKNISSYFGLRVADGGFKPYIIKQGEGNSTTWYILSLNSSKPKLIKLWQNSGPEIVGSTDLSIMFTQAEGSLAAFAIGDKSQEIKLIFKKESANPNDQAQILIPEPDELQTEKNLPTVLTPFELRLFSDKGFDNSINRSVISLNLNKSQGNITKAKMRDLGLSGEANLFLSNSEAIFTETKLDKEITFSSIGRDLFWRVDFAKRNNNQYSPWFDKIGYLDYYLEMN